MNRLMSEVKWPEVAAQAVAWLQQLIRIDTSNPPGNELPAAEWLAGVLAAEGIPAQVIESGNGRANLVARLAGDGTQAPLLLTGHLDVVPADPAGWKHPPFSGALADDCIWGRGAADMKSAVVIYLLSLVLLHRYGVKLKRDLILAGVADEEEGGAYGAKFLVENHPDLIEAEYAIGEVGGFTSHMAGQRFYPIQAAEKGHCRLTLTFRGSAGHGSLPTADNALAKAGAAAAKLAAQRLPYHRCRTAAAFLKILARRQRCPQSLAVMALLNRALAPLVLDAMPDPAQKQSLEAMLHDTANPTVLNAGSSVNVIPDKALLQIDGRVIPGISQEEFLAEIHRLLEAVYDTKVDLWLPPLEFPTDDPIIFAMSAALTAHDPQAVPLPYLMPGYTDGKHFSRLGMKYYGFVPLSLPEGMVFQKLFHAVDERLPLQALEFGLKVMSAFLLSFCATNEN